MRSITLILLLVLIFDFNFTQDSSTVHPIALTSYGKVRGYFDNSINSFKNIPYGGNTSEFRFKPPLPPRPWNEVRDATQFGSIAPQSTINHRYANLKINEDCLNLNVWTPGLRDNGKRPVMVWFHGGAYNNGTSNLDLNDGVRLCKRGNVVIVTVNHRLNIFGYLYLSEIAGLEYKESGNVGMLDLVLALKWIHDNIKEFGGDPDNITIFGQSGGGAKCATLMAMPAAQGLFNKVITESGQQLTGRQRDAATATAKSVLQFLKITPERIEELETIPTDKLTEAIQGQYFGPVTDGVLLPRDPFDPDASPLSKEIPMMMGNSHDETTNLIGGGDSTTFNLSWESLPAKIVQHIKRFIGDLPPDTIIAKYRSWYPEYTPSDVFFAATTAARSWRGLIIESERRAEQNTAPTYVFQFNWKSPVDGGKWKASHAIEIPFVFDNVIYGKSIVGIGTEQQKMADMMSEVWIAFARTGNPNCKEIPFWPVFNLKERPTMIFDLKPRVENDPREEERKLFAPIKYIQPGTL